MKERTVKEYVALFEYDDREGGYSVLFPDLPGCFSAGYDYDEAVRMAHEALSLYAEGMVHIPEPRSLEQIKKEWTDWHEWEKNYTFLIGKVALYPMKAEVKRFNISMPADLAARIDKVTSNRSAFIVNAIQNYLDHGASMPVRKRLS
jgi:predicted RNase H-like HicB family nuclease